MPRTPHTITFLIFLMGLFLLGWLFLPEQQVPETAGASTLPLWTETQTPTPGPPCYDQAVGFVEGLLPLHQEWKDATGAAGAASVVELPAQITRLQDIRRRTLALKPPRCAAAVLENLSIGMALTIQAYSDAQAQRPDAVVQARFQEAEPYFVRFRAEYQKLIEPALQITPEAGS